MTRIPNHSEPCHGCGHSLWEHEPDNSCRICWAVRVVHCSWTEAPADPNPMPVITLRRNP